MQKLDPEDDAMLVSRCRRGERDAWVALVHRYQRLVYAIVRRAGLDEHAAADTFQTVFARLIQHLPRLVDPRRLQAWIVTTAKRETLLQLKRGQRSVSMTPLDESVEDGSEWDIADASPLPEDVLAELQQLDRLRAGLDALDERCRVLLMLLFRDDKISYQEVGERLGMPVGSIGATRSRCLEKLRRLVR